MAKRNVVARTFRSTRKTLTGYFKPGAKTAEATIEQLLDVLADARKSLRTLGGAKKKRKARKTTARKKKTRKKSTVAKAQTVARRAAATAKRKFRSGGVAARKKTGKSKARSKR